MATPPLLLIVDDSRTSRLLVRTMVAKLRPDWRMVEAGSGVEALAAVEAEVPDYVSMDVNMPDMGGLEAAGRIRIKHPAVRIVLCTANIQESVRGAADKVGIGFVAKPITERSVSASLAFWEAAR